ncbi:hypothetical protein DFH08DRAFT_957132 [Mycena albidolilacea]|uniref:Uncharacterized protein n=1 Tax=Mycena albidolilacea TaxID=1033008 RepID=A0AAD7EUR9_9AGAR|nr:hypothetical protein DFH08DRAFT_957132 [Mycena albidolilacea]
MSATSIKAGQLARQFLLSIPPPSFPLHPFRIPLSPSILSHAPFIPRSLLKSTLDLGLVYFLPSFLSISISTMAVLLQTVRLGVVFFTQSPSVLCMTGGY